MNILEQSSCALDVVYLTHQGLSNWDHEIIFQMPQIIFFFNSFFIDLLKTFPRLGLLLTFTSLICESEVRVVEATQAKTGCLGDLVKRGYGYTRQVGRCSAENFIYQLASCFSPLGRLFPLHIYHYV